MDHKNQQRTRKYVGDSAHMEHDTPSKAPRQDEDGSDVVGSVKSQPHHVDPNSDKQGISNRPVSEEHAFPKSGVEEFDAPDSVEVQPKQQGGSRGGV